MFGFEEQLNNENNLGRITHLRDFADQLGLDTSLCFGMDEDTEVEQVAIIETALQEMIEEELEQTRMLQVAALKDAKKKAEAESRAKRTACHIGPYAGGICTICGGSEPK